MMAAVRAPVLGERDPLATVFMTAALAVFLAPVGGEPRWLALAPGAALSWLAMLAAVAAALRLHAAGDARTPAWQAGLHAVGALCGASALLNLLDHGAGGSTAAGLWLGLFALGVLVWRLMERLATAGDALAGRRWGLFCSSAASVVFGAWLLYLWQILVEGFSVPAVLLPAPTTIGNTLVEARSTLAADFVQTYIRSVIPGYLLGCGAGLAVGIVADRIPFLRRGLLPIGNLASALPIVAVAPIMVMWFGFGWESKAAVVVIMTFFPMLVNAIAGLRALGRMERDLMITYASGYGQTLLKAKLPAAMPFIFNALKVNSTLALIGAIVAEFFGTPILGMGFRISTEVGRMNIDMVWATIAVAAVAGSASYGLLALAERKVTFWHPSFRKV